MKKYLFIFAITFTCAISMAQTKVTGYEYWFDNQYSSKTSVSVTAVQNLNLSANISAASLPTGLHVANFRFKDDSGRWSVVISQFFQKLPPPSAFASEITAYEYWIDNNYAGKMSAIINSPNQSITLNQAFNLNALPAGLHVFNIRFKDNLGQWSSVVSQFFQRIQSSSVSAASEITTYEYWIDNNYSGKVNTALSSPGQTILLNQAFNLQALTDGVHIVNIRFQDNTGKWSSVTSQFFMKQITIASDTANKIKQYEYWIDNTYSSKTTVPVLSATELTLINTPLNLNSTVNGLHILNIRMMDDKGQWSSVISQFFQKIPSGIVQNNNIDSYEYWIDNNYSSKQSTVISPSEVIYSLTGQFNLSAVSEGLHIINIRFKDKYGLYSSEISQFFLKMNASVTVNNYMVGYRYWFDDNDSSFFYKSLAVPVQQLNLMTAVSMTSVPKGSHFVHFQFRDTSGYWSCVITDTAYKYAIPKVSFTVNKSTLCDSGSISFTNTSFDADTIIIWKFGNGQTSNMNDPSEFYNTLGTYTVKLVAGDIQTGRLDSSSLPVNVSLSPEVNLGPDTSICSNVTYTLNAKNSGSSYLWSDNSKNQMLTVQKAGKYFVTVTTTENCKASDTVLVTSKPAPVVDLGNDTTICTNGTFTLNARNPGSTYLWSDYSTGQTLVVSQSGTYSVKVTAANQCTSSDTMQVILNPVPVVKLGPNISVCEPTAVTLNPGSPGNTYKWSNDSVSRTITVDKTGKYIVTVTSPLGCKASDSIIVNVKPLPVVDLGNDTAICSTCMIVLNAAVADAHYLWNTSDTTSTIDVSVPGTYSVTVTKNGCSSTGAITITVITGINPLATYNIQVYPNPFDNYISISCELQKSEKLAVEIYDDNGKVIRQWINETSTGLNYTNEFNTSDMLKGAYILRIITSEGIFAIKIIKQ